MPAIRENFLPRNKPAIRYFSVFKLWFTLRALASAVAPESPISFCPRLWKSEQIVYYVTLSSTLWHVKFSAQVSTQ